MWDLPSSTQLIIPCNDALDMVHAPSLSLTMFIIHKWASFHRYVKQPEGHHCTL